MPPIMPTEKDKLY